MFINTSTGSQTFFLKLNSVTHYAIIILQIIGIYTIQEKIMKINFKHFNTIVSKVDIVKALLFTQVFLILSTFFDVVFDKIHYNSNIFNGNLNIYGKKELAPLLLILLLIEISALINRNEKLFVPLRIVNIFLTLLLLAEISNSVTQSEIATATGTFLGLSVLSFGFQMIMGGWYDVLFGGGIDPSLIQISSDRRLFGFHLISFALFLSLLVFAFYLYRRFYKKEKFIQTNLINYHDFITVFYKNRLLSIATYLVTASHFIPFNIMTKTLYPTPAFANHPIISASICVIGYLLLRSIIREDTSKIRLYSILEIISIIIWNPFYVFKYGLPGIGYILYIIGLGLFAYSLLSDKLKLDNKQ
jgi:membrane protein